MSQQGQQSRQFHALRIVSAIYKWLAFLGWAIAVVVVVAAFVSALLNPRLYSILDAAIAAWYSVGIVSIPVAITSFIFYVISQVVGLFLSMHDHVQAIRNSHVQANQDLLEEVKRLNGLLQIQHKRMTAILEQHHRRVAHLEEERKM